MNKPQTDLAITEAESIDFRKVLGKLWANKWIIVACAVAGLICAWIVNLYTTPTYLVSSSIIAKGEKEGVITEILQERDEKDVSSLFSSQNRNISDEIAVIRSKPLLEKILQRPEFRVSYYAKGSITNEELYKDSPFIVDISLCQAQPSESFYLIFKKQGFQVGTEEKNIRQSPVYAWGDTVKLSDECSCIISKKISTQESAADNNSDEWYLFRIHSLKSLVLSYANSLNIPEPKNSYVIRMSINSTHPARDIDFLNLLMEEYIAEKIDRKNQSALKTIEFIDAQLGQITQSLLKVEDKMERFKRSNKLASGYMSTNSFFDKVSELEREKTKILLTGNYIDYIDKYMKESDEYDKILAPSAADVDDKILSPLITELVQMQLEKNTYFRNGKERNPILNELNMRIANIKKSLQEAIISARATNELALRNIEAQIKAAEASSGVLPEREREFVGINRLYTVNENVYVMLLQKRLEADLMRAAATVDSRIVEAASFERQLGPAKVRNYALGLLLGLMLPVGLIFLFEFFRGTIENTDELARISAIPLLGSVAHIKNTEGKATIILDRPKSALAESFRALRSNLNFILNNGQQEAKVIMVTSSIAGEGKSFCSVNISLMLALSGKKVVYIIADMRKPKLNMDLVAGEIDAGQGLSTYLSQLSDLDKIIVPSVVQICDIIPAGPVPPNPSELLMGRQMEILIEELKKRYDYIVIDTPPIGLVSDPMNLISYSDANLYVVRCKYTPAEKIKYINQMYADGQIDKLTFVFNDVKNKTKGYGYYED
jgi:capsular exopolysaccharide synthesis family protein